MKNIIKRLADRGKLLVSRCNKLINKYKELISYVFFGVLTTAVDFGVYTVFNKVLFVNATLSNVIGWFAAVVFAFVTNKLFVFESKSKKLSKISYEFITFLAARIFTGVIYNGGFALMTEKLRINDYISKAFLSVFNIVVNYIFSKLITFRKKH